MGVISPAGPPDPALAGQVPAASAETPVLTPSGPGVDRPVAAGASPPPPPTQIVQQMMASDRLPGRDTPLEMTLDPPELGTIRVSVSRGVEGVTLHLHADLPETLDLLRRHGETLSEELRRHGLEQGTFSFSGGQGAPHETPDTPRPPAPATDAEGTHLPPSPADTAVARQRGTLDLRL